MSVVPSSLKMESPVLITGAGGGFDFMCGAPIGFELEEQGLDVIYASYSFTDLGSVQNGERINDYLLKVCADSSLSEGDYFPEQLLCRWYREAKKRETEIYCFEKKGVKPIINNINWIIKEHDIQTVICIDGGIDGIFRGDECDMGTPSMDSVSVISTALSDAKQKIYACTAFGTEGAEGNVSHGLALRIMSDLIRTDGMFGTGMVLPNVGSGRDFLSLVSAVKSWVSPLRESVIVNSITAAMNGRFGRQNIHAKTRDRRPWISPLTSMYWYFDAKVVAESKYFYESAINSETVKEVNDALNDYRDNHNILKFLNIPI